MPLSPKRRNLAIAGGVLAVLLIAFVSWQFRPERGMTAESMGVATDAAGIETAVFQISNRSSQALQVIGFLKTKTPVPMSAWAVCNLAAHESKRLEINVPRKHGELTADFILSRSHLRPATKRAVNWIHGMVDAVAGNRPVGADLKMVVNSLSGLNRYIRNVPVRTDQEVWLQATTTNAP